MNQLRDDDQDNNFSKGMIDDQEVIIRLDECIGSTLLYHKFKYQTSEFQLFLQHVPVLYWYPVEMMMKGRINYTIDSCIFSAAVRNPLHNFTTVDLIDIMLMSVLSYGGVEDSAEDKLLESIYYANTYDKELNLENRELYDKLKSLLDDELFVLHAMSKSDRMNLPYISDRLRDNEKIALEAVKKGDRYGIALEEISDRLKDCEKIVLEAVKQNGYAIHYASKRLRDNEGIALEAVKQIGNALEYLSDRLKDNERVVLEAITQNGEALLYASNRLQENEEFISIATEQQNRSLLAYQNDEESVVEEVKQNVDTLEYDDSDRLRNGCNCIHDCDVFEGLGENFRDIEFVHYYIQNYRSHFHELKIKNQEKTTSTK